MKTEHDLPEIWEAALLMLESELDRIMWNIHQKEYSSPFRNTGNRFECETFRVWAYNWGDEGNHEPNFAWKDVEIYWYKHFMRGSYTENELTPDMAQEMLVDCLKALREYEKEQFESRKGE